jgi:hypothetical protein
MHLIGLGQRVSGALPREEPGILRIDCGQLVKCMLQVNSCLGTDGRGCKRLKKSR